MVTTNATNNQQQEQEQEQEQMYNNNTLTNKDPRGDEHSSS